LPIELVYFTATKSAGAIVLRWQTASELNNSYFDVEVSSSGESFNKIARIKGAGNSNQTVDYEYVDRNVFQGQYYYRLKQVDFNGSFEYSRVVSVFYDSYPTLYLSLYPQPATNEVNFQFSPVDAKSPLNFIIYNMKGEVVKSQTFDANNRELSLDVSQFPAGLYVVRLNQLHFVCQEKFVIQK
jgi:hypothetical protein